jgi:hypothetical protein
MDPMHRSTSWSVIGLSVMLLHLAEAPTVIDVQRRTM